MSESQSRLAVIIDSTGAQKNVQSLTDSLSQLTEWGQKAAASAGKVTKATGEERDALSELLDRIDPVNAALNKLDKQQQELSKYKNKGLLDTDTFDLYLKKIESSRDGVSGLTAENERLSRGFEQIRAQLDPLGTALDKLKNQRANLSAARDAGLLSTEYHDELSKRLDATEKSLQKVNKEVNYGSISAGQYKNAMRQLPAQINDIATSIAGGMPLFTIFMQQGSQIADSFGGWGNIFDIIKDKLLGAGDAAEESSESLSENANGLSENAENAKKLSGFLNPVTIGFGALAAVVGALTYAWYKGSQEQDEFNKSLILTGNTIGKTSGQLADMASAVASATGNTVGISAEALNRAVSGGKIAAESLEVVTQAVVSMNDATGESIDNMVSDFDKIAQNPVAAIGQLNDKYHFLTLATYNQIKALQDEGNQQEAARLATDTYATTVSQRAKEIQDGLGLLETAWNNVSSSAKSAWDSMLDIGREDSLELQLQKAEQALENARKSRGLGNGMWNTYGVNYQGGSDDEATARKQIDELKSQIAARDTLNGIISDHNKVQQEGIAAQQRINTLEDQSLTNAQKRKKALEQLTRDLKKARAAGGSYSLDDEAKLRANIEDRYKDPKTPKGKAYTEDAGNRMLDQLNQQYSALENQLYTSDKIGESAQALIKWEQKLSDIKEKKTLTAEQKSLLANQDAITTQLKKNAAIEKEIALRKDSEKLTAYKNDLSSGLGNDAMSLQNSLNSNTVLSQEQQRQQELAKIVSSYQKKQTILTNQRTTGQISDNLYQQETQALQTALNERLAMQQSYYTQLDSLNSNWEAGVNNGLQSYLNSIPTAYQASTDAATSILGSTQTAISSNLSAMLQGTESLSDGFKGMAMGMGQAVIDALTKMAAQWLVYEAVQLLVGKTAAAGAASSMIAQATAMSQIAAINAYASAAAIPITGWAIAPVAMASAEAATFPLIASIAASSAAMTAGAGFEKGGYTGSMGTKSVAGVVHGQEYVFDAAATRRIGVSNLEAIRSGNLDATLSKPGFGTGNNSVSASGGNSQTNHISQVINMPQNSGMTQQEMDSVLKRNNKQLVTELSNQTLEGKGQFGKSLRAAQGRGNRMT